MLNASKKPVSIEDLTVVTFPSGLKTAQIDQWRLRKHVPFAEACARQIWYGDNNSFSDFPSAPNKADAYTWRRGREAYAFLVTLAMGLESKKVGEVNIKGQFYVGWSAINQEHAETAKRYEKLVQNIGADTRSIQKKVCSGFQQQRYELSARDLSGQKKGESILIIGHLDEGNKLSCLTDGIARVSGNKRSNRVQEILFTHPDPMTLEKMEEKFIELYISGKLTSDIVAVPFSDLPEMLELCDRAYVTLPMDFMPESDQYIINAWQARNNTSNTLTHLKANPDNMGLVVGPWASANLKNYISPYEVRNEMQARAECNKKIIEQARRAALSYADFRFSQESKRSETLRVRPVLDMAFA